MKKRKRKLLLIAVLTASLSISACGPKEPETVEEAIEQSKSALENLTEQAEERDKEREKLIKKNRVELKDEIVLSGSEADVKIKAYSVIPWNSFGEEQKQMYFIFDYTNKSENDAYFSSQIMLKGYQDGIELNVAPYFDDTAMSAIRPNKTIERTEAIVLRNTDSDIELVITEINSGESVECTLKVK